MLIVNVNSSCNESHENHENQNHENREGQLGDSTKDCSEYYFMASGRVLQQHPHQNLQRGFCSLLQCRSPHGHFLSRQTLRFHRKHNLNSQSHYKRLLNLVLDILTGFIIAYPICQCLLSDHSQSLIFPFFRLKRPVPVAVTSLQVRREHLYFSILRHSLMSWDSNIFASVFFTRRAVRRQDGL